MKVYCFYLVRNHISCTKYLAVLSDQIFKVGNKECVLYAFTTEKSSELSFISSRNMDIFFEKIIDIPKEDYEKFYDEHIDQALEYYLFNSKKIVNGVYKTYSFKVLCTLLEYDHVVYYKEESALNIISKTITDSVIDYLYNHPFKKSLRKVLNNYFIYDDIISKIYPMEDINYDNFIIDDLSLYIKLFSNTYKGK